MQVSYLESDYVKFLEIVGLPLASPDQHYAVFEVASIPCGNGRLKAPLHLTEDGELTDKIFVQVEKLAQRVITFEQKYGGEAVETRKAINAALQAGMVIDFLERISNSEPVVPEPTQF